MDQGENKEESSAQNSTDPQENKEESSALATIGDPPPDEDDDDKIDFGDLLTIDESDLKDDSDIDVPLRILMEEDLSEHHSDEENDDLNVDHLSECQQKLLRYYLEKGFSKHEALERAEHFDLRKPRISGAKKNKMRSFISQGYSREEALVKVLEPPREGELVGAALKRYNKLILAGVSKADALRDCRIPLNKNQSYQAAKKRRSEDEAERFSKRTKVAKEAGDDQEIETEAERFARNARLAERGRRRPETEAERYARKLREAEARETEAERSTRISRSTNRHHEPETEAERYARKLREAECKEVEADRLSRMSKHSRASSLRDFSEHEGETEAERFARMSRYSKVGDDFCDYEKEVESEPFYWDYRNAEPGRNRKGRFRGFREPETEAERFARETRLRESGKSETEAERFAKESRLAHKDARKARLEDAANKRPKKNPYVWRKETDANKSQQTTNTGETNVKKLCIVSANYPNEFLEKDQLEAITEEILYKLEQDGYPVPDFKNSQSKPGWLSFSCDDKIYTWIKDNIGGVQPWEGAELKLAEADEAPYVVTLTASFPNSQDMSNPEILKIIDDQNSGIFANSWRVVQRKNQNSISELTINVGNECAKTLSSRDFQICYQYGVVKLTVTSNHPEFQSSGRSSAYPSIKATINAKPGNMSYNRSSDSYGKPFLSPQSGYTKSYNAKTGNIKAHFMPNSNSNYSNYQSSPNYQSKGNSEFSGGFTGTYRGNTSGMQQRGSNEPYGNYGTTNTSRSYMGFNPKQSLSGFASTNKDFGDRSQGSIFNNSTKDSYSSGWGRDDNVIKGAGGIYNSGRNNSFQSTASTSHVLGGTASRAPFSYGFSKDQGFTRNDNKGGNFGNYTNTNTPVGGGGNASSDQAYWVTLSRGNTKNQTTMDQSKGKGYSFPYPSHQGGFGERKNTGPSGADFGGRGNDYNAGWGNQNTWRNDSRPARGSGATFTPHDGRGWNSGYPN